MFFGERHMECANYVDFCRLWPLTIDSLSEPLNYVLPVTNVFNLSPDVGVIVLPAVAAFLFSLAALALKRANQLGVDVWQTAFVVNISAGAIYSALWFVGGPSVRMELWYQPMLIAICLFVGMLAQFMALSRGDVSVAVPVMGLKLLVVAIMSPIVVGEAIPFQLWIAVALSLLEFYFTEGRCRSPFRLFDELGIIRQRFQQAEKNSGNANNWLERSVRC